MGRRPDIEPTVTREKWAGGEEKDHYRHPAFGRIAISRHSSGSGVYHGSDFRHQYGISIEISRALVVRGLSNDWHHEDFAGPGRERSRPEIVQIQMTEAQWSEFVSSVGSGSGVPCTLLFTEKDGMLPGIAAPIDRKKQFETERDEVLTRMEEGLKELAGLIEASNLPKVRKAEMASKLTSVTNGLNSSLPFIREQFGEFVENTVAALRMEGNGQAVLAAQEAAASAAPAIEHYEPRDITPRIRERVRHQKEG